MLTYTRYIFFFSLIFLLSCGKNEFSLDFNLKKDVTENFNVTYYASGQKGGMTMQAVASVRDGKCVLPGVTHRPTLVYISTRHSNYPLLIYAERGEKIEISGEGKEPLAWNVTGNPLNEFISKWRQKYIELLTKGETDSVNQAVKELVEENRDNPASTLLLLTYFNRGADEFQYSQLMASLKGKAKQQVWLDLSGRTDQLLHAYSYPARLENLVMRSVKEGADTLRYDSIHPVFLIFWQTGFQDRKNLMDSIKSLKKEFPDSVRIIADVCADIDSTGWRSAIRKDSIDYIKRLWTPLALADPTLVKLKVTALPYFIVFNPDGTQSYRGNDLKEALDDYRSLLSL